MSDWPSIRTGDLPVALHLQNPALEQLCRLTTQQITPDAAPPEAWPAIVGLAEQHGLAPMLHAVLQTGGALNSLADQDQARLRGEAILATAMTRLALAEARVCAERFAAAGIRAVWIKGIALSHSVYDSPALRPMGDIDVLVPFSQRAAALSLLCGISGQRAAGLAADNSMHATFRLGAGQQVVLELHWSLLDAPSSRLAADSDWFLQQTQPLHSQGVVLQTLTPEAHLLYLAAHAILQHGEAEFRLLRFFDLHCLITKTPLLDWRLVIEPAVAFRWTYALARALLITQTCFATPLPADLLAELQNRRPADEDISHVVRRQQPANRWQTTLHRFAAMNWRARARLAAGLAFPSPAYMRWRYRFHHSWQTAFYYPYRWLDIVGEIGKTLLHRH